MSTPPSPTSSSLSSYEDALQALFSPLHQATTKEALERSAARRKSTISDMREYWRRIFESSEHLPQEIKRPKFIHITGTKGKGSTACQCEAILLSHGYSTGLFTSPHLMDIRERIRWNGKPIHQNLFASVYWKLRNILEKAAPVAKSVEEDSQLPVLPGYFRMLTLMAYYTFHILQVDVWIVEVGMGGRYDATNFLNRHPLPSTPACPEVLSLEDYVCGVTLLDLDHTRVLGNTLEKIAWEKAGIFAMDKEATEVDLVEDIDAEIADEIDVDVDANVEAEDKIDAEIDAEVSVEMDANIDNEADAEINAEVEIDIDANIDDENKDDDDDDKQDQEGDVDDDDITVPVDNTHDSVTASCFILDSNTESVVDIFRESAMTEGRHSGFQTVDATGTELREALKTSRGRRKLGLAGDHQYGNAILALHLCYAILTPIAKRLEDSTSWDHFVRNEKSLQGLIQAVWPGRCQTVERLPAFTFRLDGAHTPQSVQATLDWFNSPDAAALNPRRTLVFYCSHERNPIELLQLLMKDGGKFTSVYFARPDSLRPSAVPLPKARALIEQAGMEYIESSRGGADRKEDTWQDTLSILWKQLSLTLHKDSTSSYGLRHGQHYATKIISNLSSKQVLQHLTTHTSQSTEVLVIGSLYLVGSFLEALRWEEGSSPDVSSKVLNY